MEPEVREFVRRRAHRRCEYCRFREQSLPYLVFHVDHIVAKQHLDEVSNHPDKLAWACSHCNYHKGPNLVSIDPESKVRVDLFDPRSDDWEQHFSIRDGKIVGKTATGRATARLLSMNSSRLVRLRQELVAMGDY